MSPPSMNPNYNPYAPRFQAGSVVVPGTVGTAPISLPPPYQLSPVGQGSLLPGAGQGGITGQTASYFGIAQPVVNPQCCPCPQ